MLWFNQNTHYEFVLICEGENGLKTLKGGLVFPNGKNQFEKSNQVEHLRDEQENRQTNRHFRTRRNLFEPNRFEEVYKIKL